MCGFGAQSSLLESISAADGSERERGTRVRERVRIKTDGTKGDRERERVPGRKPTAWSRVDFTRTTYNLYA